VLVSCGLLALCAGGAAPADASGTEASLIDAIFVIDNSGSMRANDPEFITRRVVMNFAARLDEGSRLGLVLFDERVRLLEPLSEVIGREAWVSRLDQVDYRGQLTDSPAGIERALYELKTHGRPEADKVIVFITDGIVDTGDTVRDREKKRWLSESLTYEAIRNEVRIFGIAFTDAADFELIQELSSKTRGEYFRVYEASDIPGVFTQIAAALSVPEQIASAESASSTTPPVSAPQPGFRPGGFVLAFGLVLGALLFIVPLMQRRSRLPLLDAATSDPLMDSPFASAEPLEPVRPEPMRSQARQPVARLIDVGKASVDGLLPLSIQRLRTSVGRDSGNDVVIQRDTVSSFHATVDFTDGYFYLEDHRSTNGTFLNGNQLHENKPIQLKSGDRIDFSDHEFRFIIPDHEPRGRTAVLERTRLEAGAIEVAEPLYDGAPPAPADPLAAFEQCLRGHLEKLRGLGLAHRDFVDRNFDHTLDHAISRKAEELLEACGFEGSGQIAEVSRAGVHYTLCILPDTMEEAAAWYLREYGGYAKFLVNQLDKWASDERSCEALCVITFGAIAEAWISITVVPANDEAAAIEVMSFEFLSEDERRRALSLDIVDVGRIG
jgi:pSer/pThr/pTyr-binding forkhead associated (FHA) protein/Mg-chelatase subunit ChlD